MILGLFLIACQKEVVDEVQRNQRIPDQLTEEAIADLLSKGVIMDTDEDGNTIYITPLEVGTPEFIKKQKAQLVKEFGISGVRSDKNDPLEEWFALMFRLGGETEEFHFDIPSDLLKTRTHTDRDTDVSTSFWFTKNTLPREVILSFLKWGYDRMTDNDIRQWRFIPYQLIGNDTTLGGGWDRSNLGKEMTNAQYLNLNIERLGDEDGKNKYYLLEAFPSDKKNRRASKHFGTY